MEFVDVLLGVEGVVGPVVDGFSLCDWPGHVVLEIGDVLVEAHGNLVFLEVGDELEGEDS